MKPSCMPAAAGPKALASAVDYIGHGGRREVDATKVERALAKADNPVRIHLRQNLRTTAGRSGILRQAGS